MRVIAVASQKGGSGKTTVAIHLVTCFTQEQKKKVVLILTHPSFLDIRVVVNTLELVQMVETEVLVVLNQCPPKGQDANEAEKAISALDVEVSAARLTQRAVFGRALLNRQTAMEAEPKSKAALEFRALGKGIIQQLFSLGEDP